MVPKKHALGVFLDNPGQTYINLGAQNAPTPDTSFMGALFGELNLYFIYGGPGALSCPYIDAKPVATLYKVKGHFS